MNCYHCKRAIKDNKKHIELIHKRKLKGKGSTIGKRCYHLHCFVADAGLLCVEAYAEHMME